MMMNDKTKNIPSWRGIANEGFSPAKNGYQPNKDNKSSERGHQPTTSELKPNNPPKSK
jgi:hypothetical protein